MQLRKTDLFTIIHKALRSLIYNAGAKLQTVDFSDKTDSDKITNLLRHDLELLHEHADHEDNIIFPEVKNEEPEMIFMLEKEHKEIGVMLQGLHDLLDRIDDEPNPDTRVILGNGINISYNNFAAAYLLHMNHEESTVLGASWKYLSDDELIAIRTRIQTKIPPERYRVWLDWMLRSMNNLELTGLLGGMKVSAPQHIFDNVTSAAEKIIDPARWQIIKSRIPF